MYFLIFLVTRFSGLRIGASVTHSGGNINRTCLDFFRKCHHPSLSLLCCANCARNHLPLITKTRIDTRICHTCSFVFGAYCENGTRSTRDVTFNTHPHNNGSPPGGMFFFKSIKIGPELALDFANTFRRNEFTIGEEVFASAE